MTHIFVLVVMEYYNTQHIRLDFLVNCSSTKINEIYIFLTEKFKQLLDELIVQSLMYLHICHSGIDLTDH
jgi:hypothetical protein